jgi:hypothetical protein
MGGANGNLYKITDPNPDEAHRVPPFILSDAAPTRMNHEAATRYCAERGATLPTKEQLKALGRAMSPGGRYNPNAIPGARNSVFWSLSVRPSHPDLAFYFSGSYGFVDYDSRLSTESVRCVLASQAW